MALDLLDSLLKLICFFWTTVNDLGREIFKLIGSIIFFSSSFSGISSFILKSIISKSFNSKDINL